MSACLQAMSVVHLNAFKESKDNAFKKAGDLTWANVGRKKHCIDAKGDLDYL